MHVSSMKPREDPDKSMRRIHQAYAEYHAQGTGGDKLTQLFSTEPHGAQVIYQLGEDEPNPLNNLYVVQDAYDFNQVIFTGEELADLLLKLEIRHFGTPKKFYNETHQDEEWQNEVARELNFLLNILESKTAKTAKFRRQLFRVINSVVSRVAHFESISPTGNSEPTQTLETKK